VTRPEAVAAEKMSVEKKALQSLKFPAADALPSSVAQKYTLVLDKREKALKVRVHMKQCCPGIYVYIYIPVHTHSSLLRYMCMCVRKKVYIYI
jgi:hypothetical protein